MNRTIWRSWRTNIAKRVWFNHPPIMTYCLFLTDMEIILNIPEGSSSVNVRKHSNPDNLLGKEMKNTVVQLTFLWYCMWYHQDKNNIGCYLHDLEHHRHLSSEIHNARSGLLFFIMSHTRKRVAFVLFIISKSLCFIFPVWGKGWGRGGEGVVPERKNCNQLHRFYISNPRGMCCLKVNAKHRNV